jgi:hypothetical protein
MEETYLIRESVATFADSPEHIEYHIRSGDYLAMVATALGCMEEALETCASENHEHTRLARELRDNLRYVHAKYTIVPRPTGEEGIIRPSGNLIGD